MGNPPSVLFTPHMLRVDVTVVYFHSEEFINKSDFTAFFLILLIINLSCLKANSVLTSVPQADPHFLFVLKCKMMVAGQLFKNAELTAVKRGKHTLNASPVIRMFLRTS